MQLRDGSSKNKKQPLIGQSFREQKDAPKEVKTVNVTDGSKVLVSRR